MKILICGDRNWPDGKMIEKKLLEFPSNTIVITGSASGADNLAEKACDEHGYQNLKFPAKWRQFGKAAGPIRNRQMLDEKPDLVIAFHDCIASSKGTKDCVTEALNRKIAVQLINKHGSTLCPKCYGYMEAGTLGGIGFKKEYWRCDYCGYGFTIKIEDNRVVGMSYGSDH